MRLNTPLFWREALSSNWHPPPTPVPHISLYIQEEELPVDLGILKAKVMYDKMVTVRKKSNAAFIKWTQGDDGLTISGREEWTEICKRVFSSSRETKLQSFQYRTLNRIIPCKVFLKRIKITDSDGCPFCQNSDTIVHFFFQCERVQRFWREICNWFKGAPSLYLNILSPKEFVFGVPNDFHRGRVINFILIHLRFYIYRQKLFHEGRLCTMQWLDEFRSKLRVEKWVRARLGRAASFRSWDEIVEALW